MATRDGTGEQAGMTGTSSVTVFSYFPLFFFSRLLSFLSQTTATGRAGPSGTGQDGTTRAATAMRDRTGGRRAGGGGERRLEGGLAENIGTAEAEGQATKGCEQEIRGAYGGRRGGWAGGQVRAEAGQHGCCPASALAICWSRHRQFPP